MQVVVQISTAFLGDDEEELVANLPISFGAADLYHALETMTTTTLIAFLILQMQLATSCTYCTIVQ